MVRHKASAEHLLLTHREIQYREVFVRLRQEELLFITTP
jgi:hypothetical protein